MNASGQFDRRTLARALATTTAIQILSTATALALTAIAPAVAAGMHLAPYVIGYQISLIYLSGACASAVAGTLVDRYGAVRMEQLALLCFAVGLAGLATGNSIIAIAASLLIGLGYGVQNPASSHILDAVAPRHRRNIVFSIKQAGVPVGGVIASLAFPALTLVIGWRAMLLLAALAPIALIVQLARDHRAEFHESPVRRSILAGFIAEQRLIWSDPSLRVLSLIGMLYSSVQLSLSAFTVTMLVAQGWSLVAAGAAAAMFQVCGAAGRVGWGHIADWLKSGMAVLAFIGVASVIALTMLIWLSELPTILQLAPLVVLGLCANGWNGVLMAEATRHSAPKDVGRVIGGTLVYTFIGVAAGPSAFASLVGLSGAYSVSFLALAVVASIGALVAGVTAVNSARAGTR